MTIRENILACVKEAYPLVVHKAELLRKSVNEWGHESETTGRECRFMVNDGYLVPIYGKGCVMYRWTQKELEKKHNTKPLSNPIPETPEQKQIRLLKEALR